MLVTARVPFVDARASDLSLALGRPPAEALGRVAVELGPFRAELRVLGCSHQALVRADGLALSETVACLPGEGSPMPDRHEDAAGRWRYRFEGAVARLDRHAFARRARALVANVGRDPRGLVSVFPGPAGAFTAVRFRTGAGPAALAWETWHGYPQAGELVLTRGTVSAS